MITSILFIRQILSKRPLPHDDWVQNTRGRYLDGVGLFGSLPPPDADEPVPKRI